MQSEKQWDHYTMAMTRRTETYHLHSYLGYIPRAVHWKSVGIIQPSTKDVQRTKDSNHLFLDDAVKHPLCLSASATFDHSIPRCRRVICYCIPPPPPMSASLGFSIQLILHAACCMLHALRSDKWRMTLALSTALPLSALFIEPMNEEFQELIQASILHDIH